MRRNLLTLVCVFCIPIAFADPVCGVNDGATVWNFATENVTFTFLLGGLSAVRREIADEVQETIGSGGSINSASGVVISGSYLISGAQTTVNLPDPPGGYFRGAQSPGKHTLNRFQTDVNEEDPYPCVSQVAGGGGGEFPCELPSD